MLCSSMSCHMLPTLVFKTGEVLHVLSYDVALNQWITSCHKNHMTTRVITLWRERITSLTKSASTMRYQNEKMFILKAIKSHFKRS